MCLSHYPRPSFPPSLMQTLCLVIHWHLIHPAIVLSIKFVSESADLENSDVSTVSLDGSINQYYSINVVLITVLSEGERCDSGRYNRDDDDKDDEGMHAQCTNNNIIVAIYSTEYFSRR